MKTTYFKPVIEVLEVDIRQSLLNSGSDYMGVDGSKDTGDQLARPWGGDDDE